MLGVPLHVGLELGKPIRGIRRRKATVLRAAMPKAAVDEDRHSGARKDHIRTNARLPKSHQVIDSIPQAAGVKQRTHCKLGTRITMPIRPHAARGGRWRFVVSRPHLLVRILSQSRETSKSTRV